jgi:hypothetical protein
MEKGKTPLIPLVKGDKSKEIYASKGKSKN